MPSVALLKDVPPFAGFPAEGRRFLAGLALHNEKTWFDAHRDEYEQFVLGPMRAFVLEAGSRLRPKVKRVVADPRVGGSLFRINRDTRFSADKSPYKSWAAARLWDGAGPGKESSPSFYLHVDAESVYAGGGLYLFDDAQLERFRRAVTDDRLRRQLERIAGNLGLDLGGQALKRRPRGYAEDHPAGDWLRFKGLHAGATLDERSTKSATLLNRAVEVYESLVPLHQWLMEHVVLAGGED
jgi:uncharacterized protein (TIGR02453 family)